MDTTETYIKMCEKAVEIQKLRKEYSGGDWLYDTRDREIHNVDINFHYLTPQHIWLPRQDQLQEMVTTGNIDDDIFNFTYYWTEREKEIYLRSWEQFWLAFVMKEKFNKVWNGEDWINAPTG